MLRTRSPLACALVSAMMLTILAVATAKARPSVRPAARAIIANLPHRFRLLKPGMAEAQVWKVLGMPERGAGFGGEGGGPPSAFSSVYWVGPYNLVIVIDSGRFDHGVLITYPARLKSATLSRGGLVVAHIN